MSGSIPPSSLLEWIDRPSAFLQLSYPASKTAPHFFPDWQHYGKGPADVLFVLGWAVLLWLLRELTMKALFAPFMRRWLTHQEASQVTTTKASSGMPDGDRYTNGGGEYVIANGHNAGIDKPDAYNMRSRHNANGTISPPPTPPNLQRRRREARIKERKIVRFAEQGWSLLYYAVFWVFGCFIHYHAPYYRFDLDNLWKDWPHAHSPIPGPVKFYYLTQLAFWVNQLVIINVEARRKDHAQMMTHHIVTASLMVLSYQWNFTRVGCLIQVLLDFCDILLPLAKMGNYLKAPVIADVSFGVFLLSWLVTREGLYSLVVLSVINDAPRIIPFADKGVPGVQLSLRVYRIFAALLSILAVLLFLWLAMIVRVAIRVLRGEMAADVRSDDEGDSEESLPETPTRKQPRPAKKQRRRDL